MNLLPRLWLPAVVAFAFVTIAAVQDPPLIEAPDLAKRPDLIGKQIKVEARVALYQVHPGRGFDEIMLKQSEVPLRLPPHLSFPKAPDKYNISAKGVLTREAGGLFVAVQSLELIETDRARLERWLTLLPPGEIDRRRDFARWAARRAHIYKDESLAARAKEIDGDIIVLEAARPELQKPDATLALVTRAREAGRPAEPTPTSWAHRALHALAKAAKSADDLAKAASEIERFLPKSSDPALSRNIDLAAWNDRYEADPEGTYVQASSEIQVALDRKLLADTLARAFEARAAADPAKAIELAADAHTALPDRPELATKLLDLGLKSSASRVGSLRQSEMLALVGKYNQAGRTEEGRAVIRAWLDDQRKNKLGRNDADGRIALADQFRNLLGDTASAISLLNEAYALDNSSKEVADAFRRLGYRFDGQSWVDARSATATQEETKGADRSDPLIGLTLAEILSQRGKPNTRSVAITQGSLHIQWNYNLPRGGVECFDFVQRPGSPAVVESRYVVR